MKKLLLLVLLALAFLILPFRTAVIGQQIDGAGDTNVSFVYRVRNASEARSAVQRIK